MSAVEALRDGDLERALSELQAEIRANPGEPRHRVFLFQLMSILGNWDRALTQLHVVRDLDPGSIAMVRTYETVLHCEQLRAQMYAGEKMPLLMGTPEPWMAELLESLKLSSKGEWLAAQQLRTKAFDAAPASAGTLTYVADAEDPTAETQVPFAWIADADTRLGPMLEVIVNGRIYWVPFQRISRIDIEPPVDLRDLAWLPARFLWSNQGDAVGFIPTRYPGTESSDDAALRLSRRTDWQQPAEGEYWGIGQRLLATDESEFPVTSVRRIEFDMLKV